jgi:hypothetical protein
MTDRQNVRQKNNRFQFTGFSTPRYTQVPDQLFDELLPLLNGSELKVLLYICRRTFGFKKDNDNISINQMVKGITRKDGSRLDHGAGLSKTALLSALKSLVEKNVINIERRHSAEKGNEATNYRLHIQDPLGRKMDQGEVGKRTKPLGRKMDQEQETVNQHTEAALVAELLDFAIDKPTVNRLVRNHDRSLITQKIDYVTFMQEEQPDQVRSPRGWLLKAIEDDYGPPAGYRPRAKREQEEAKKVHRGEAAERKKKELQKVRDEAAQERRKKEEETLDALRERYGTTRTEIELWQDILGELKDSASAMTYGFAKLVHLLTIQDETAVFATNNSILVERIRESIGSLLVEMFHQRGHNVQEMKAVILSENE